MITITHTVPGRSAWTRFGGGLNLAGDGPGPYFRSATGGREAIGLDVARKIRDTKTYSVHVNDYAIYRGALEVQKEISRQTGVGLVADGIWGPKTDAAVKAWQEQRRIKADGIYGQQTAKTMWLPVAEQAVEARFDFMSRYDSVVLDIVQAHISGESMWDVSAVGSTTPKDVGIGQINLQAYPDMTESKAFTPRTALTKVVDIVVDNLHYAGWDYELAIVSYNLGRGGAENWDRQGRPVRNSKGDLTLGARYLTHIKPFLKDQSLIRTV